MSSLANKNNIIIPKGIKISDIDLEALLNKIIKSGLEIDPVGNLQFKGTKRLMVLKCYDKGLKKDVILKVSTFKPESKKLTEGEYLIHSLIYKYWPVNSFVFIPKPYDFKTIKIKDKSVVYFKMECINDNIDDYNKLVKNNELKSFNKIIKTLHNINVDKLFNYSFINKKDFSGYHTDINNYLKDLRLTNKYKAGIDTLLDKIDKDKFNQGCGCLVHSDLNNINIIVNNKKIYLIDLEMIHVGHKFEDWSRILIRADIFSKEVRSKTSSAVKKSYQDADKVKALVSSKPTPFGLKKEFIKSIKNKFDLIELDFLLMHRYLWYIQRKFKIKNQPIYRIIINFYYKEIEKILSKYKETEHI